MQLKLVSAAAVSLFAATSAFAEFPGDCSVNDLTVAATACSGIYTSNGGNNLGAGNTTLTDLSDAFGDLGWSLATPELAFTGEETGLISIAPAVSGPFAIALKAGSAESNGGYSLYFYDGSFAGISELTYNSAPAGKGLSHASLYVGAVPEPETYAMLLAGLVGVGFVARRRRVS